MTAAPEPDIRTGADRKGYYIRTFTGKQFHLASIDANEIDIRDIAHALSMNCRWTGHVRHFFSVAQHCLLTSYEVPPQHALAALLHDASEAYIHDTPSPLKWYLKEAGFTAFATLEKQVDAAINKAFGVPLPRDPCVKEADLRMLATENIQLMPLGEERIWMIKPYDWQIVPMLPATAEAAYLKRFYELYKPVEHDNDNGKDHRLSA